mgnify:FL=1
MNRFGAATSCLLALASATIPLSARAEDPPSRIIDIVVYGDDPCPPGKGDEIVVCARKPESERYRIPKELRKKPEVVGSQGWGSQVANMESVARQFIPGSCSVNGSFGFSGCTQAMLRQWWLERQLDEQKDAH